MPIFEYECKDCSHQFEFLQFRRDEKVNCPKCDSKKVARLFSVFGFWGGGEESSKNNTGSKCSGCSSHSCNTCK